MIDFPIPIGNLDNIIRPDKEVVEYLEGDTLVRYKDPNAMFVTLSSNVRRISKDAFKDCKRLSTVIIPDTVEYIEKGAFKNVKTLEQVSFNRDTYLEGELDEIFEGCNLNIIIRYGEFGHCVLKRVY